MTIKIHSKASNFKLPNQDNELPRPTRRKDQKRVRKVHTVRHRQKQNRRQISQRCLFHNRSEGTHMFLM